MTPEIETPESLRRQAEGTSGVRGTAWSVHKWPGKARGARLVTVRGVSLTPQQFHLQWAAEAAQSRVVATGHGDALSPNAEQPTDSGGQSISESPANHPANRSAWPRGHVVDMATGELLPCRSLETTHTKDIPEGLTGPHKKVAAALSWNVAHLCQKFGIERVGFLTLTFADHVLDVREASRRFNNLANGVLRQRYGHYIRVLERQKNGRIHYHLLVVLADDIRTGANFEEFKKGKGHYGSANNHLRREWAFWRKTSPLYRFGWTEILPIRSDAAAMGQYVGKYIGKHIAQREERDKGARLVSYSGDARMATSKHMALEKPSTEWRGKCLQFSRMVSAWKPHARIDSVEDLSFHLGPRWSYHWRDFILKLPPADLSVPF